MMSQDELIQKIEADQRWLTQLGVDVKPPPGCIDRLKQRVQLALDEAWLARQGVEVPPPANLQALKQAVTNVLGAHKRGQPHQSPERQRREQGPSRTWRIFAALSAAAVLLLAVGLYDWPNAGTTPASDTDDDFDTFTTLLAADLTDEEIQWQTLQAELDDLESALASVTFTTWDRALTDDLGDDLDALADELLDTLDPIDRGAG